MTALRDGREWVIGRQGEAAIRQWLKDRGFDIVDIAGNPERAPVMERADGTAVVMPDIDAYDDAGRRWVEVKTKGTSTLCRKHKRNETGLSQDHWAAYQAVAARTHAPGYLCIIELSTGFVLEAPWQRLHAVREHSWLQGEAMWYFPRDAFDLYDARDYVSGIVAIKPGARRTIEAPPPPRHRQLGLGL